MSKNDGNVRQPVRHADDVRERNRRQKIRTILWWLPSLFLHLAMFAAVGYFGYTKYIEEKKKQEEPPPPPDLSEEVYEKLSEHIESVRLSEIYKQLLDLQIILHNMDVMKNQIAKTYDEFAEAEADKSKEDNLVDNLFERAIAHQEATLAEQQKVRANEALAKSMSEVSSRPEATEEMKRALNQNAPSYDAITASQADTQTTLDRIVNETKLIGLKETARLTEGVREIQLQENMKQSAARQNVEGAVWDLGRYNDNHKRLQDTETRADGAKEAKRQHEEKLAQEKAEVQRLAQEVVADEKEAAQVRAEHEKAAKEARDARERAGKSLEAAKQELGAAQSERDQARRERQEKNLAQEEQQKRQETLQKKEEVVKARDAKKRESENAVRQADQAIRDEDTKSRQAIRDADGKLKSAKDELARHERSVRQLTDAIAGDQRTIDRLTKDLEGLRKTESELLERERNTPPRTAQEQDEALQAQLAIQKKVKEIQEFARQEKLDPEKKFTKDFKPDVLSYQDVSTENLVEAYEIAQRLETKITESFKDIKAFELAMMSKTDYESAEKLTDVVKAVRRQIDEKVILEKPKTQAEFDRQKQEQADTVVEAQKMVDTTLAMMEDAMEIVERPMADMPQAEMVQVLQKFALEFEAPPPPPQAAQETQVQQQTAAEEMENKAYFEEVMKQAAAESQVAKAKDLSELMAAVDQAIKENKNSEEVKKKVEQIVAANKTRSPKPEEVPYIDQKTRNLIPGNIIDLSGESGVPGKWMHVSSWYVVGPFDNPNRVNLTRKFAPESAIDLNATYIGMGGRKIKWEFHQAHNNEQQLSWDGSTSAPCVIPPGNPEYTIWYGYTEVVVDRDCDLWLATGSDDRSDIWINDMHVWNSSNVLKGWTINEGFRKVHFRKGRNRILLRCENGWHGLGWSLAIYLGEGDNPSL